jgi:TPR repeat protein
VAKDIKHAAAWMAKAAEQGHADAQYNLAAIYCNGDGVAEDAKKGLEWLMKAVEQGHAEA